MKTKLLAVMFTDVAGYTAFSSTARKAEITAAIQRQKALIGPIIGQGGGRLIKWIGDAAMATFESATTAVMTGHKIQTACMADSERSPASLELQIKVVVSLGDVYEDADGDVYGTPVNLAARMEKLAKPGEVYFTNGVRQAIPPAEIPYEELPGGTLPHEYVGEHEFKGIPERTWVYRTCFGQAPVVRQEALLIQTDSVGILDLADRHGWDNVQPVLDQAMELIIQTTRAHDGTNRGIAGDGCLLSFGTVGQALRAIHSWSTQIFNLCSVNCAFQLRTRTAAHKGTLHVMRHTLMGRDMHIAETLVRLGTGDEVLMTDEARESALQEGVPPGLIESVRSEQLRRQSGWAAWMKRYETRAVYLVRLEHLAGLVMPKAALT